MFLQKIEPQNIKSVIFDKNKKKHNKDLAKKESLMVTLYFLIS